MQFVSNYEYVHDYCVIPQLSCHKNRTLCQINVMIWNLIPQRLH